MDLIRYDAARRALDEAKTLGEMKDLVDRSEAIIKYARLARNPDVMGAGCEMRFWAEVKIGEEIAHRKAAGTLAKGTRGDVSNLKPGGVKNTPPEKQPTLEEQGIDKNLAKRGRERAAIPEDDRLDVLDKIIARGIALYEGEREYRAKIRAEKNAGKRESRAAKEQALTTKITALPDEKYGVIYADPPWKFEFFSDAGANYAGPENHYPLQTTEDIMALPVADIAADDCILFLWATAPMAPQALDVMEAWGFTYKSQAVWVKHKAATGFWFRGQHELLLIGTKGKVPAPAPGDAWPSVIEAPSRKHSQKPDEVYDLIEAYFPTLPKIELNARGPARDGWETWGNEAEKIPSWLLSGSANPERLHDEAKN